LRGWTALRQSGRLPLAKQNTRKWASALDSKEPRGTHHLIASHAVHEVRISRLLGRRLGCFLMRHILAIGCAVGAVLCAALGAWHAGQMMSDIRPGASAERRQFGIKIGESSLKAWLSDDYTAMGKRRRWWMLGFGVLGIAFLLFAIGLGGW